MAYAVKADVENIFGDENVAKWIALGGDMAAALVWAEAYVNSRLLAGPYAIPFASAPTIIVNVTATFAGVEIYEARGIEDADDGNHILRYHRDRAEKILNGILESDVRFDLTESEDIPVVV